MPSTRPPYPAVFRQQMIELVRSGRTPGELAREFEPSAQAIRNWVAQADRDAGERSDGLRTEEREELRRLRWENGDCARNVRSWQKPRPGEVTRSRKSSHHVEPCFAEKLSSATLKTMM